MLKNRFVAFLVIIALLSLPFFTGTTLAASSKSSGSVYGDYYGIEASLKSYTSEQNRLKNMEMVKEDSKAQLFFDKETAQVGLRNKVDGHIYLSSPYDVADMAATDEIKERISAPLRLLYYNKSLESFELNSFTHAAMIGQVKSEYIENGVAAIMTVGKIEQRVLLPEVMPEGSFNEYIENQLAGENLNRMISVYRKYDLAIYDDEMIRQEFLERYPGLENGSIYALRDTTDSVKKEIEGYFKETTYSFEQLEKDYELVMGKPSSVQNEIQAFFHLRLEYTLQDGQLVVRLPAENIEYNTTDFTLQKVWLLEYFGATDDKDEGYMLLPDGSGAILDFNSPAGIISTRIYGPDTAVSFDRADYAKKAMRIPIFGVRINGGAFLAVVEEGAAMGEIYGVTREGESGYNKFGVCFNYNASDRYIFNEMTGGGTVSAVLEKVDKAPYSGDFAIRYSFLDGKEANYSGMAYTYRKYLKDTGGLSEVSEIKDSLPLYFGALGAVDKKDTFLLFPVTSSVALTSFSDMKEIASELTKQGISNLNIRYFGWANGGLEHSVFNKALPVRTLGGKSGFKSLVKYATDNNIGLYPDAELTYTYRDGWFDGYSKNRDSSRQLNDTYARIYPIDYGASIENLDKPRLMIKPQVMQTNLDKFLKSYQYPSSGLSLGSMGSDLHSHYSKKDGLNRAQALDIYQDIMETASQKRRLMLDGGNAYTYKYAGHILNLDSMSSAFSQATATVPFMQMVLHGSLSYAGAPVNLASDVKKAKLKAIENGESLYFIMAAKESEALRDSDFADYFSVDYNAWKDSIVGLYREVSDILDGTYGEQIVMHEYLTKDIVKVTYSNDIKIVVNYSGSDYDKDGVHIPAESALRLS